MLDSLFNKVAGLQSCNFVKKRLHPTQEFSCEYCGIFNNTCFEKQSRTAVSAHNKKRGRGAC